MEVLFDHSKLIRGG